jgi:hypothetical protein
MEVRYGQQLCFPVLYPLLSLPALAFRAMTITATIITDAQVTATGAAIDMTAQCSSAASPHRTKGTQLPTVDGC